MANDNLHIPGTSPVSARNWIDVNYKRREEIYPEPPALQALERQRDMFQDSSESLKRVKSEDKIEQRGAVSEYQPERAVFTEATQEAAQRTAEEFFRDERELAKQSILFRDYFKGGIGISLDVLA